MKRRLIHSALVRATNVLLIVAALTIVWGTVWEYTTRAYLNGFTDAVVPGASAPEAKVEAILSWMSHGPARKASEPADDFDGADRDPENTLNYELLLKVCGTATNAFVNLADSAGLSARRLLLVGPDGAVDHVVAEVRLDRRWVVVDPAFRTILKNSAGDLLTREELANPAVFRQATAYIPGYDPAYKYTHTEHIHLGRVPFFGGFAQKALDFVYPEWKESLDWTLLLERRSYAFLTLGLFLFLGGLVARHLFDWYGRRYLGLPRAPLFAPVWRAAHTLLLKSPNGLRIDRI